MGSYTPFDFSFKIRKGEQNLYIKHPEFDVAIMYIDVPEHLPITVLSPAFLADDKRIEELDIHPGDTVLYLGFPLAATTQGGFSFLRGGRLSSYPLIPVNSVKEWNIDGPVDVGNSGGPVYFYYENRNYKGATHVGYQQGLLGLVIQQINSALPEFKDKSLNSGVIVPAQFIKETIETLPSPD